MGKNGHNRLAAPGRAGGTDKDADDMKRILIVDDDPRTRDLLRHDLRDEPYEMEFAEDGLAALGKLKDTRPDLVLMDLYMPGVDGIAAIRALRTDPELATLPIVFLSSETDRKRWVAAFEAGANDFVPKPYERAELKARLRTHLRMAALNHELAQKNALMEHERQLAKRIQRQMLPRGLAFEGLDTALVVESVEQIGGSFLEAWQSGDCVHLVAGDVSEAGTSAALLMAVSKGVIHPLVHACSSPLEVIRELNSVLHEVLGGDVLGTTVSLLYTCLNSARGELAYVGAGQAPAFLLRPGGAETLPPTGPSLGEGDGFSWETATRPFGPDDTLLVCNNGLLEPVNRDGDLFGHTRLPEVLDSTLSPDELVDAVMNAAVAFSGGRLTTDVTLLAVKRKL